MTMQPTRCPSRIALADDKVVCESSAGHLGKHHATLAVKLQPHSERRSERWITGSIQWNEKDEL